MSSSTTIKEPIQIFDEHLFCGNRTYLRCHPDQRGKLIPRGASHVAEGAKPGYITLTEFSEDKASDKVYLFRPVDGSDTASGLSGWKDNDEPLFEDAPPRYSINKDTLTVTPATQDAEAMSFVWDRVRDVETAIGQPYSKDQVEDLSMNTYGVTLIDLGANADGLQKERMSLYKLSKASEDAINAMSDEVFFATLASFY